VKKQQQKKKNKTKNKTKKQNQTKSKSLKNISQNFFSAQKRESLFFFITSVNSI